MICPNCQIEQSISEQNYGALYTCSSCQAVYFINFEGQAEYGEVPTEAPVEAAAELPEDFPDANDTFQYNTEMPSSSEDMFAQNQFEVNALTEEGSFADVAKNISDFGNNESQLAALNYDLELSAIDTKEIIKQLAEAIDDSKFGWDSKEMIGSIKNGTLSIKSMSPVKAYLLAKRIRFLDIEKKWKQNVLQ